MCFFGICCCESYRCCRQGDQWTKTIIPCQINNLFCLGWLHFFVLLIHGYGILISEDAAKGDRIFDRDFEKNKASWNNVTSELPVYTSEYQELNTMFQSWSHMFSTSTSRGIFFLYYQITIFIVISIHFLFLIVIIANEIRFCCCGKKILDPMKQEFRIFRGKFGYGLCAGLCIVTITVVSVVGVELDYALDVEYTYEQKFPFCMASGSALQRFCLLCHRVLDNEDDYCSLLKDAIKNSYVCHDFYKKMYGLVLAAIAGVLQFLICYGYYKMASRGTGEVTSGVPILKKVIDVEAESRETTDYDSEDTPPVSIGIDKYNQN